MVVPPRRRAACDLFYKSEKEAVFALIQKMATRQYRQ